MGKKFIYDLNTKNISFIQTAVDLKRVGIKNNMFFLKLYDHGLAGIDPFDPNLSDEFVIRITTECLINPWYFLRECVRIPDQGNPNGIPYLLNRATLASAWCFINGIDNYLVIPRQIGKTQSTISILDWAFLFGTTDSEFMFLNMQFDKSVENLQRLKDQRDLLPKYLQFKLVFDETGKAVDATDNVKTLTNAQNGNKIVTKASATSVEKGEKIGRGSTQPIQYYDEFEFIDHIKTIMEAAGPAFVTASRNAKRNNAMYGRIFTSTPGDLDSRSGQQSLEIIENTYRWTEKFYDIAAKDGVDTVRDIIYTNSANGIVYIEYQYQQLGKDEAWFSEVCRVLNNNPLKIKREIFLKRIHGSQLSPYDPEDLESIMDKEGTILEEIIINQLFKVDIYTALEKTKIYFVGVDVANGYGSDNSAITIFDPYTFKTVGEFKSAHIGVKQLIKLIYVLIKKYIPRSILIIERNANGEAVLDHLRDTDISINLYHDNTKDLVGGSLDDKVTPSGMRVLEHEAARRRLYGVYTQGKSREIMFSILEGLIHENKECFVGKNVINDIMKLVRKNNKIQADSGAHDDSIMSFLMCMYVYYHGNNLYRYGFVRGSLPTEEERNKGMHYGDILEMLSDNDKAFFEGAGYSGYESMVDNTFNIRDQINKRGGLIESGELEKDAGTPNNISFLQRMNPYERKIYEELAQAKSESMAFDKAHNIQSNYERVDDEFMDTYVDLSIFDELNN